ncbi:MAG: F420-nonreducing hydrogenase [Chloroflexi bacterium RBG_13_56_8]|nr:MAG: F420-nonreducing hydrogenase [Chloroflexi bacterium RBG_13_56_8]
MRRITIDPITRLEGHGKITIFLDDQGDVANAYFQVPEFRGFEAFCEGRPVEEMPRITQRICGVCPMAHHMAAAKAADAVFKVQPPPAALKIREMAYNAFVCGDHATHFYVLAGPDFIVGPDAEPAQRHILGIVAKVGVEIGKRVIQHLQESHEVLSCLGGRFVHPVMALPGGVSKGVTPEMQQRFIEIGEHFVAFSNFTLQLFRDAVLGNEQFKEMILSDAYLHRTHNMGLVDENNCVNFYDGHVRVVDVEGNQIARYHPSEYQEYLNERVEPWTYLKFPYLKTIGWKGLVDGMDSGIYRATPLGRLNVADGMATPLAQEAYEEFYDYLGGKPVHATLATHWARVVEMLYAGERMLELAKDPEITDPNIRTIPTETPGEGVGLVEAPRGTLTHHYIADERGLVEKVNLIVGTTNNHAAICMSIKKAAQKLIGGGKVVTQGLLNRIEMAFRAYDPCLACATHTLPGEMSLEVSIMDRNGNLMLKLHRDGETGEERIDR